MLHGTHTYVLESTRYVLATCRLGTCHIVHMGTTYWNLPFQGIPSSKVRYESDAKEDAYEDTTTANSELQASRNPKCKLPLGCESVGNEKDYIPPFIIHHPPYFVCLMRVTLLASYTRSRAPLRATFLPPSLTHPSLTHSTRPSGADVKTRA